VNAAVEANVEAKGSSAVHGTKSIFTGDLKLASAAVGALKQQLSRNVELLSSLNALLFPEPGSNQSVDFSR
jgi:hypothetical protein